jgi:hypothetical protein
MRFFAQRPEKVQFRIMPRGQSRMTVASALYQMAIADEIEDSGLKQIAGWAWDALDLADAGHIAESRAQVVTEMARALEHAAEGTGIAWSARVGNMRPLA